MPQERHAIHPHPRRPRGRARGETHFTPVATPIYHASSYVYDEMETLDATFAGTFDGPMYTRYGNPTVSALEAAVAALEGGEAALAYGSGMAAIHGALLAAGARAGTTVVAAQDVLRRDLRAAEPAAGEPGRDDALRGRRRSRRGRGSPRGRPIRRRPSRRADRRDDLQPAAEGGRPARAGRAGARGRRGADRGQHLRVALPVPAAGLGRRLCRTQRDQVPGRPRRRVGRRGRDQPGAPPRAERDQQAGGRQPGAAGGVAGAARDQDAAAACPAPVRERRAGGRVAGRASAGEPRQLSRASLPTRSMPSRRGCWSGARSAR